MNWSEIKHLLILQPENLDGDSIASALALEEILGEKGIEVTIYAYTNLPEYLKYIQGADRLTEGFPNNFDATIIVDTVTATLLENTLTGNRLSAVNKKPVLVLDHHPVENDLPLQNIELYAGEGECAATGEIVFDLAKKMDWPISKMAATHIVESILADTLGLVTPTVTPKSVQTVADCLKLGASMEEIDVRRREYMKKTASLVTYKGVLLQRVEYVHSGKLALVHIPWEEIEEYSPHYNPSMLALEELRNTKGVEISVAFKTYPDGKITGKIRSNNHPLAGQLAAHFGGGGHDYAAGFKTNEWKYEELKQELVKKAEELLKSC